MNKRIFLLVFLTIFLIHTGAFILIRDHSIMIDENYHYRQIVRFLSGDFRPDPLLSMIPGYHAILAAGARILHVSRFQDIRLIGFLINVLTIPIFYLTAREIDRQNALVKTLHYSFFPLIFPYFSLIYTDIFSLLFILLSLFTLYKKHYLASGIIASVSILARQNNIVWLIFLFLFIYIKKFGWHISRTNLIIHLSRTYTFVLGPLLLCEFLILNGAMTIGDRQLMYLNLLNQSNIFIIIFLFPFLFLPLLLSYGHDMVKLLWKYRVYIILLVPVFFIYYKLFTNTHLYNQAPFFLHNALILYFTGDTLRKLIFFSVLVMAVLFLLVVKLKEKAGYLLYPITAIFLIPIWFMEWRYYITSFVLFLLFRETRGWKVEYGLFLYFLIFSFYFYSGIFRFIFFL